VLISVSEELRLLEYGQRLRDGARKLLATQEKSTGRAIFDAVVAGGTQASGIEGAAGIRVGASADLLSLRADLALTGRSEDQILDTFIFADARGLIDSVWRAGRKVVSGGVHLERAPVARRFRAALQRLVGA
jgi:formimidoylglutamate deiminase